MTIKILSFLAILLTFLTVAAYPQNNIYPKNFRTFTTSDGFYNDRITSLLQDTDGFIWIGTSQGIFIYNGNRFEQPAIADPAIAAIIKRNIQQLFKDKSGNIWIGSGSGLCIYLRKQGKFKKIKIPESDGYYITGITQDPDGAVWAFTNKGLFRIDGEITLYHPQVNSEGSYRITFYRNQLWLINHNTVYEYDIRTGKIRDSIKFNSESNIPDNIQTAIATDRSGNIWIGKYNGILYKYNCQTKTSLRIDIKKKTDNPAAIINHLCYDTLTDRIWASVDEGGVFTIDPATDQPERYITTQNRSGGLPTLKITNLLIDRERNIWFSMEKYGLAFTNDLFNAISYIDPGANTTSSIVSAVLKDSKGNLWVGTDGGGLLKYNKNYLPEKLFRHKPEVQRSSLANDAIMAITEDSKGKIWIGTFRGGLSLYNPHNKTFTNFQTEKNPEDGPAGNDIRKITEDNEGNLWLTVHGYGVSKFNTADEKFTHYRNPAGTWPLDLIKDHTGTIWVAAENGIACFVKSENTFRKVISSEPDLVIHCLFEDQQGTIWIGSSRGLYFINRKNSRLEHLNFETILNNTAVQSIEESSDGRLFIAIGKGLIIFDRHKNKTTFFNTGTGLPDVQFIANSSASGNDLILFGTSKGLCYFNPTEIKPAGFNRKPLITSVSVFNDPIEKYLTGDQTVTQLKDFKLKYNQNKLTFSFAFPYFRHESSQYNFQYMLEGIDHSWNMTTGSLASYTSLPPGKFRLRLRVASKSSANEHSPETTLNIEILPPFWATMWFKILIISIPVLLFWFYTRYKTRSILKANKILEEKISERTEAISKQNELLEKQRAELESANISKDKLFSVIAHDLRGPFSSIMGISSLFHKKHDQLSKDDQAIMVNMLRTSSENAFHLLDNLLEWARSQRNSIQYNPKKIPVSELCDEIFHFYKNTALEKQIKFNRIYKHEITALTDKELLQTILRNLVNNAVKFTPPGGEITMETRFLSAEQFCIEIRDSGKGMNTDQLEKLKYSSSFLNPASGTSGESGTGLGLWICREFLPLIHARWEIISEPGHGTTFIITVNTATEAAEISATETSVSNSTQLFAPALTSQIKTSFSPQNKVILIAEDQPEIRESLKILLSDYFQIIVAENGAIAWELIQENYTDLILSDVVMPEMNGIELIMRCREENQTSHIPFIMLTSQKEEADIIKGIQSGADDYLVKPVNAEILLLKINQLLKTRDLLKKKFSLDNQAILDTIEDNAAEKEFLQKVLSITDENLHRESFGVEELSRLMGMHRSSLSRKLVAVAEVTPNDLIKTQRLKKAAHLLPGSGLNVSQVAYEVGFSDPKYFSRSFKAYFGSLPTEYIQLKNEKIKNS
jgi:ligand-binding sensor domain-containing protein/signal transduction histidine kinase/DNA-binding response OmpR family regulator